MTSRLQQMLASCTDFDQVLSLWGLNRRGVAGREQGVEALLERVKQPQAARWVWERLATSQERVVLWHCVGKNVRCGIKREDLLTRTKLAAEEFNTALSQLTRQLLLLEELFPAEGVQVQAHPSKNRALAPARRETILSVFAEMAETLYQTGRELFIPGAERVTMSLAKLLQSWPEAELWRMIHHYALDMTGLRRASELRAALAEALTDPDLVLGACSTLDTFIQEVYSWLLEQGGKASVQAARSHFAVDDDALFALLETLSAYGLAFDTLCPDVPGLRLLFIPQALFESIQSRATVTSARQQGLAPLPAFPVAIDAGLPVLVSDLAVVVNTVYQQRVELTREGTIVKHCTFRIQPLLRGRSRPGMFIENTYLDMLFETAECLLLIQRVHPPFSLHSLKPYYEPGPELGAWAQLNLVEQTQRLLSWWATSPNWYDVTGSNFQQWNPVEWKPLAARPLLISALQHCAPGAWYRIDDFLQSIWEAEPYAMHSGCAQHTQELRPTAVLKAKWLRCEGEVLRGILVSTLWELGLVSLGSMAGQGAHESFQLTELGAAILQSVAPESHTARSNDGSLVLLPTGEVLLLELDTILLYRLLPFVEIRQVDRAICLAFTRSSIIRAIDQGHTLEALLEFLEGEKHQSPPQNVLYMLKDWAQHYAVAELNHVLLLSISSVEGARLLVTAPRYRAWGFRQLAPHIIAAPAHAHLGELRRALEAEGLVVHLGKDVLAYPAPLVPQQSEPGDDAETHSRSE